MLNKPLRIAITGAAGQIAYQFIFMLFERAFSGCVIELYLLDIANQIERLKAIKMELEDCAIAQLKYVLITDQAEVAFNQADWIIMLGAYPRMQGMQRSDLLSKNAQIFKMHGLVIDSLASKEVQVVVVGNPCNTNAMIASSAAKTIPKSAFTSMSVLDQNRAVSSLANYLQCSVDDIDGVVVWGNHSSTLVPDAHHATCRGLPIPITSWMHEVWIPWVQNRGAQVIEQRGSSSAASAAYAICDHIRYLRQHNSAIFSLGVHSKGEYGSCEGTWVSMPHQMQNGQRILIDNIKHGLHMKKLLKLSFDELAEERSICNENELC